jgi:hypothetical protein
MEDEGAILGSLGDHLLDSVVDVVLGELFGGFDQPAFLGCRLPRSAGAVFGKVLSEEELLRLLDVLLRVIEEGLFRGFRGEAIDFPVSVSPIH